MDTGGNGSGGAISSAGSLIMEDCVIQNNSLIVSSNPIAQALGGGVSSSIISGTSAGILNINRCSFYNNSTSATAPTVGFGVARALGGGLFFNANTTDDINIFITNSTFSSNTTSAIGLEPTTSGGGMQAQVPGGRIVTLNLTNNIFANSVGGDDTDFAGGGTATFATNNNNISETCGTGCPSFASTSDPLLGAIEDCVFTRVHRLQAGSPAINTGTAVGASTQDQCFGPRIDNTDIGAIEFETPLNLPVELLNFTAKQRQSTIVLFWQTASKTNNKGFEIEKSSNSKEWKAIDFV